MHVLSVNFQFCIGDYFWKGRQPKLVPLDIIAMHCQFALYKLPDCSFAWSFAGLYLRILSIHMHALGVNFQFCMETIFGKGDQFSQSYQSWSQKPSSRRSNKNLMVKKQLKT